MSGLVAQIHPRKSVVWIEETPNGFRRHEVETGEVTLHTAFTRGGGSAASTQDDDEMAKEAKKAGKGAKAETKKTGPKGPRNDVADKKIKILVTENPRREGTRAFDVFKLYKNGMTVKDFIAKGGKMGDINWDLGRKNIELT